MKDQSISLKRFLGLVVLAVGLAFLVRAYAVETVYAASGSMEPTLDVKQFVFVIKCWYAFTLPKKGDVVLLQVDDRGLLKRIVGLPGEKIEIKDKDVYINDAKLDEPFVVHRDPQLDEKRDTLPALTIPEDSYFVMGDNRDESKDSRAFGPVKREQLQGKVILFF